MAEERTHAIVLGASMAGLLTARILSESFAQVTVIERDDLSAPGDRRGVPQGRHVHALLARGTQIFEELFPGLTARLLADGAVECRALTEMRMSLSGHTLRRSDSGYSVLQASRPFLEWRVRERVRALPNVVILDSHTAEALDYDAAAERVRGVRVDGVGELAADLVVSCLGRHGPIGDWLAESGYERPPEEGVRIDMMYASRYIRLPAGVVEDKEIIVSHQDPARGLAMFAVEDGRHLLTLIGYGNDHPPTDPDGYWRFAASVAPPDVRRALVEAQPLTDVATYRYLANQRRRYERLSRFPDGLLVLGDAVCSFSPAFGQGMTVSALQALQLREILAAGDHELPRRWFRAAAAAIDDAWMITKLFDLAMPHVDASGQARMRLAGHLAGIGLAAGARDERVGRAVARIAGLLDRPSAVLHPETLAHTATALGGVGLDHARRLLAAPLLSPRKTLFDPLPHGPARGFHRLTVRSVMRDTRDSAIVEFTVPADLSDSFRYTAGQHLVVRGTRDGEPIRRSYSLCDPPGAGRLRIGVKRQDAGTFSTYVFDGRITGSVLYVAEPAGTFTPSLDPAARRHYAAVAAGSGITPIAAIIAAVLESEPHSTVALCYGNRAAGGIMLADRLHELVDRFPDRLRIRHQLSQQGTSTLPRSTEAVSYRRGRIDPAELADADHWFLCGPRDLVSRTVTELTARGVDRSRIQFELFDTGTSSASVPAADTASSHVTVTGYGPTLTFDMSRDRSILDAALDHREDLPYSCLGGSCGTCRATVESGQVMMDDDPLLAISDEEITAGHVLACRARPVSAEVALRFAP
ncbi:2Fe-2S iron-sulfur cluster-binding protein [Nocardia caishijiensis]|uniref:Ferredoxin-NADP reductase n=1 Tax=Nocardia caishijiensis TaxID=184756 RepID=A0ABQ6YMF6_9NOCA|nr:2Fe-2S iron-sulfur cluster-binding protein [Nocardia caishijiensis]KAF0846974.1 ferredoxin-NADP reductase [Nocardia caishijiensis]